MFIPVGHDVDGLRRWPVVTFAIIALCCAVFLADSVGPHGDPEVTHDRFRAAAEYYLEHPELAADPLLRRWIDGAIELEATEVRDEMRARLEQPDVESTPLQEVRQAKLDELTAAWMVSLREGPAGRRGLIPNAPVPERYLTHMFVHGDIFHLVFNMLFLYLSGPLIEDVWGRPFFLIFYLATGMFSAWLFVLQYPDLSIPLIGASGAVAGMLGAMLVRHPQTRIRILWLWGFVVRRFSPPAWVVLPVWVGGELLWAYVMDLVSPGSGGGGVAHWVHVYGFVFGAAVAGAVGAFGIERVLAPKIDRADDHVVLRAVEGALARERHDEAWQLLADYVVRTPADRDAALTYWDLAKMLGRARDAAPVLLRVIRTALLAGESSEALTQWQDLRTQVPDVVVATELAARLASALGDVGHAPEAADLVRDAVARVDVTTPASALVELARAARFADPAVASAVVARALAHPGLPVAVRRELSAGVSDVPAGALASAGADSLAGSR